MLTAQDIMTREVISVGPEMEVEQLAALLWENKISGVPVVENGDTLIGVVTESDLIDQTKKIHIPTVLTILDSMIFLGDTDKVNQDLRKMTGTKVKDLYSDKPFTVTETTPVDEIATIMAEKRLHTLPVVRQGKLVGIIGKADIIRSIYQGKR
ncbi:MAG: CBS domain-containing protein [Proteobacteria bacterium]|nr:CBS domain-containing protein [Pseudomonadota bacterium]MBU1688217.1 CBS domain-containing protein [Pseudomonadota bacterium]